MMRLKPFSVVLAFSCLLSAASASGAESLSAAFDFRDVIARAKREVFPSVVFLMPVAERFDGGEREKTQVAGSGLIISPEGEIVTNWHVVDKAVDIRCLLSDGTARRARIVGTDKDTDIALLRLEGVTEPLPAASFADSDALEEGQFVMAMGAPWGLSRSVSMGILSCVNRFLGDQGGGYNLWLQTDASINPGNSGGPLVNTDGKVVGLNSLGFLFGGNLAFAIPSNTVADVANRLRADGRVVRAWTGLHLQPLRDFEKNIFYDGDEGALVAGVDPGSPADAGGVRVGQLLLSVNGTPVRGINHEDIPAINRLLADLPVGAPALLSLRPAVADGAVVTEELRILPLEKGLVEGGDFDCRRWNMTVKAINEFATPLLHFFRAEGVYVQAVKHPGNAAAAGLRQGDIILEIDGVPVPSLDACREMYETILADGVREKKVVFTLLRGGLRNYQVLDYSPVYGEK